MCSKAMQIIRFVKKIKYLDLFRLNIGQSLKSGKCRHIYLEGHPQHKDKSKFITQVILPLDENIVG